MPVRSHYPIIIYVLAAMAGPLVMTHGHDNNVKRQQGKKEQWKTIKFGADNCFYKRKQNLMLR